MDIQLYGDIGFHERWALFIDGFIALPCVVMSSNPIFKYLPNSDGLLGN